MSRTFNWFASHEKSNYISQYYNYNMLNIKAANSCVYTIELVVSIIDTEIIICIIYVTE